MGVGGWSAQREVGIDWPGRIDSLDTCSKSSGLKTLEEPESG